MQTEIEAVMEAFDRCGISYEMVIDEDILEADRADQPERTPRSLKQWVTERADRIFKAMAMLEASPAPFTALRLLNEDYWYFDGKGNYLGMEPGLGTDFAARGMTRMPKVETLSNGGACDYDG